MREVAWAEDGTIEGLEDPERRFAVGVLWHPEAGEDLKLFEALVAEARAYREERRVTAVFNPATEEPLAELESAGVEETDAAVARAKAAYPAWRAVAPADRARLLRRLATLVEEHHEELARIESRNVGKPISGARGEVGMVAQVFHFYAGAVDKFYGETIPVAGGVDMTFREPLGVVGLITPWNFPLNIASWKLGPALACGNTVVLKPAELTPLSSLRLGELALEAGIPEGVVNVVVGKGSVVGQRLIGHPDVAKIGFTGSTEVGQLVMQGASHTIKRVTLELGGKSANVVFADADLEQGGCGSAVRGVRQRRAGLLRALAHPRRAERVRPVRRADRRGDAQPEGRRPGGRRDGDGPAHLRAAPRDRREASSRASRSFGARRRTARATGTGDARRGAARATGSRARRSSARWRR